MKIAVFPGSFDPITLGHIDIITRAIPLFDKIIVAVGENSNKKYMFSKEQRMEWIKACFSADSSVEVAGYSGLTVDYCKSLNAGYILRGLRNSADFEFEKAISHANHEMMPSIETIFLVTASDLSSISSSIVRDIIKNNGDYTKFVPAEVRI